MSINYNAVIGKHAKATLPSVDGWQSTNSILRDPPKSITTRRIDRVDADGSLNKLYAESGDRFSENINLYARGVNPFVAVQYGNTQYSSGRIGTAINAGMSNSGKLPYRIMDGGAFRPPQLTQEQLLPLSRQPRNFTSMASNPQFVDYTKTIMCNAQKTPVSFRQVKKPNMNVNTSATANKSQNIRVEGTKEHYVNIRRHVVQNPIIASADAKISALGNTQIVNRENCREAKRQINTHEVDTNKSQNIHITISPENEYVLAKNIPEYSAESKRNDPRVYVHIEPENEYVLDKNIPEYSTESKRNDPRVYVHIEPENEYIFQQKVVGNATTNITTKGDYEVNRNVTLPQTLSYGGFSNYGIEPSLERNINYNTEYTTNKRDIANKIAEMRGY
jgi:predicted nucleic acid-binding Zn finger protein